MDKSPFIVSYIHLFDLFILYSRGQTNKIKRQIVGNREEERKIRSESLKRHKRDRHGRVSLEFDRLCLI
jgi:hypothetical protein